MRKNIIRNKKGNTLLEIMFAVSIFVVLIGLTLGISKSTIESQKRSIAAQNTQESMRYVFEAISKELRNAQPIDSVCENFFPFTPAKEIYNVQANSLYIKNKNAECIKYYVDGANQLIRYKASSTSVFMPITPNEIKISGLGFNIEDNDIGTLPGNRKQPYITIKMKAESLISGASGQSFAIQTTISSRHYE